MCWSSMVKIVILRGGALTSWSHEDSTLMDGFVLSCSLTMWGHRIHYPLPFVTNLPPCGDTQMMLSMKNRPLPGTKSAGTWFWTSQSRELWEVNFHCLKTFWSQLFCDTSTEDLRAHVLFLWSLKPIVTTLNWNTSKRNQEAGVSL
jgi:hypothetical protein